MWIFISFSSPVWFQCFLNLNLQFKHWEFEAHIKEKASDLFYWTFRMGNWLSTSTWESNISFIGFMHAYILVEGSAMIVTHKDFIETFWGRIEPIFQMEDPNKIVKIPSNLSLYHKSIDIPVNVASRPSSLTLSKYLPLSFFSSLTYPAEPTLLHCSIEVNDQVGAALWKVLLEAIVSAPPKCNAVATVM
jgi:hypothetical protein